MIAEAPPVFDLEPPVSPPATLEHQIYSLNKKSRESRCKRIEDSRW